VRIAPESPGEQAGAVSPAPQSTGPRAQGRSDGPCVAIERQNGAHRLSALDGRERFSLLGKDTPQLCCVGPLTLELGLELRFVGDAGS
jgi:hypothetical protein